MTVANPGRLAGKRALVIGAGQTRGRSTGVGRATAITFAREGATVMLVDRDEESVTETAELIEADGGTATVHLANILEESECAGIAAEAERRMGGVDVLFDSIGILGAGKPADVTSDFWDTVMNINLKAMWMVTKHVLPIMQRQRSGSIVLISSIAALRDGALRGGLATPYAVSKAGVDRLAISLASAYAEYDIRTNAILPGLIDTPMAIDATLEDRSLDRDTVVAERQSTVPMSFIGTAYDIAHAALFFASDESRYVSGQRLVVDGARSSS